MTKTAATKFQVRWRKSDEPDTLWSSPVDVGKDGNIDVPGLERVTDYVFQARAGSACGAWSDWVVQTFNMPEAAAPEAVSSLTAQSVADGVHLSWASIIADGGTKFAIERSTSSDSGFAERARTTATAYTDPETSGTVFYYRVRAVNYRGSFGPYSNVVSSQGVAVDALGDDVAAAQQAAANAQQAADAANTQLADIASDNVLSSAEKPNVARDYDVITTEQAGIDGQADAYGITTEKTAYDNAVSALTTYLNGLTSPTAWNDKSGNTTIAATTFKSKFTDVYSARQTLLDKIYAAAKSLAATAQTTGNTATQLANQVNVQNPGFDAGDVGWIKDAGWTIKTDGAGPGQGAGYAQFNPTGGNGAIKNQALCFVTVGQVYKAQALIRAIGANGSGYVKIAWLDANLNVVGSNSPGSVVTGTTIAGSFVSAPAPAGAVYGQVWIEVDGCTTGTYQADNVVSNLQPSSIDEVPDGQGRFAAVYNPATQAGIFQPAQNLLTNPNGFMGTQYWPGVISGHGLNPGFLGFAATQGWSGTPGLTDQGLSHIAITGITPGLAFTLSCDLCTTLITGGQVQAYMSFQNDSGTELLRSTATAVNGTGFAKYSVTGTAPAGTTRLFAVMRAQNLVGSGIPFWRNIKIEVGSVATPFNDQASQMGNQLTSPGSGQTIGDQRNLLPVTWAGVRSVIASANPISYSISGTTVNFSVTAFNLSGGGFPVSYNASSGSVTQAAGTTATWYLYYRDPTSSGGSKTLGMTIYPQDLAAYPDVVRIGSATVTVASGGGGSSGTGSGGGGGSGDPPGYPVK